jgi:hypothetical protein
MVTPAGTPDFRGNSSSCIDAPPVFLAVFDIILSNQEFYRREGKALGDGDELIDRQTDGKKSRLYGFTDTDRMAIARHQEAPYRDIRYSSTVLAAPIL